MGAALRQSASRSLGSRFKLQPLNRCSPTVAMLSAVKSPFNAALEPPRISTPIAETTAEGFIVSLLTQAKLVTISLSIVGGLLFTLCGKIFAKARSSPPMARSRQYQERLLRWSRNDRRKRSLTPVAGVGFELCTLRVICSGKIRTKRCCEFDRGVEDLLGAGFLALTDHEAAADGQGDAFDVEPLAVVARPDRAKLGPERAFSLAGDNEGLMGRFLGLEEDLPAIVFSCRIKHLEVASVAAPLGLRDHKDSQMFPSFRNGCNFR